MERSASRDSLQLLLRLVLSTTILAMAVHHTVTWQWYTSLMYERFLPVFGLFIGERLADLFLRAFPYLQTFTEFLIALPLLAGRGVTPAARGACVLYFLNITGLILEQAINPGDQETHRLQVVLWNHLQFVFALALLCLARVEEAGRPAIIRNGRALSLLALRVTVGSELLISVLWCAYIALFSRFQYFSLQADWSIPALEPLFPVAIVILGGSAVLLLLGVRTQAACVAAGSALLFMSCQFLMKEESRGGVSIYFNRMHVWNLAFFTLIELCLIAGLQEWDRYALERRASEK